MNVVRLCWAQGKQPRRALIVKKKDNIEATEVLIKMVEWLQERNVEVLVEPHVVDEVSLPSVRTWSESVHSFFLCYMIGTL